MACACVSFVFKVGVCVGQQPRLCLTRHSTLLQTGVALVSKPRTSEADFGVHQKGKEEFPTQAKLFFFFCYVQLHLSTASTAAKTCPAKPDFYSAMTDTFMIFFLLQQAQVKGYDDIDECCCPSFC